MKDIIRKRLMHAALAITMATAGGAATRSGFLESIDKPPVLSIGPRHVVGQAVAVTVKQPVHDAVHGRSKWDAVHLKATRGRVAKFLQSRFASYSVGLGPLLHHGQVPGR